MAKAPRRRPSVKSEEDTANNPLFNKDFGQHILKNPLVAQGIVDKVRFLLLK